MFHSSVVLSELMCLRYFRNYISFYHKRARGFEHRIEKLSVILIGKLDYFVVFILLDKDYCFHMHFESGQLTFEIEVTGRRRI